MTMAHLVRKFLTVTLLMLGVATTLTGQSSATDSATAARKFVESFYRWYVPIANRDSKGPSDVVALREKRALFSATLYRALKADTDAQAKAAGEIVGLDYDPFLNNQDPCAGFVIGAVTHHGATYRVAVHSVCNGRRDERPSALAEVQSMKGSWEFVDFHSGDGKHGLLAALKVLARERKR